MGLEKIKLIGWINKDNTKFLSFGLESGKTTFIYSNLGYAKSITTVQWKGLLMYITE